jgi:hypothetical protein
MNVMASEANAARPLIPAKELIYLVTKARLHNAASVTKPTRVRERLFLAMFLGMGFHCLFRVAPSVKGVCSFVRFRDAPHGAAPRGYDALRPSCGVPQLSSTLVFPLPIRLLVR